MSPGRIPDWHGCSRPEPVVLQGAYTRLEPLAASHAQGLATATAGRPELYEYLHDEPPANTDSLRAWIDRTTARTDLLMWAVVDRSTGMAGGRQALMRIDPGNGVVELGSILWGSGIARTRIATQAFALHAQYVFDTLGYRRLEWKCDSANEPSKRAARRLGFTEEGTFAQHMVVKGRNRDTTWFALLDHQWPDIHARLAAWLDPTNFDEHGRQILPLGGDPPGPGRG